MKLIKLPTTSSGINVYVNPNNIAYVKPHGSTACDLYVVGSLSNPVPLGIPCEEVVAILAKR